MRHPGLVARLVLLFVLGFLPSATAGEEALGFGLISPVNSRLLLTTWQPFLNDMAARLGRPVTAKCASDYAGVIWAMAAGTVHVAWLGNKSAIEAVDRAGGEVALRAIDLDGRTDYRSHLLARTDGGIRSVEDMLAQAGRLTYGDGDRNSTSGHVVPDYFLFAARGLLPRAIFKRVLQGSHEANFLGLAAGTLDVATGNSVDLERLRKLYPDQAEKITVLWTSPPIPSDPIVWRADLPAELKARIRAFFLDYGRPGPGKSPARTAREKAVLAAMARSGFCPSDNSQLETIRILELSRERGRIEAPAGAAPDDRAKLEAIDARLRRLRDQQASAS